MTIISTALFERYELISRFLVATVCPISYDLYNLLRPFKVSLVAHIIRILHAALFLFE